MSNAKSSIPFWEQELNQKERKALEAQGFSFEVTSQGYRVEKDGKFVGAAGTIKKPHGRYAEANRRDNLQSAILAARRHTSISSSETKIPD